jgi:surface-adhesin protein E
MFLIAAALLTTTPPDRWVHVGGRTNDYEEYVDKASVRRSGRKVTLWTRRDFVPYGGAEWHELEFDCSTRTGTILAYIRDDRGTITHNVVRPHREASPIPPASVEETIFEMACR